MAYYQYFINLAVCIKCIKSIGDYGSPQHFDELLWHSCAYTLPYPAGQ